MAPIRLGAALRRRYNRPTCAGPRSRLPPRPDGTRRFPMSPARCFAVWISSGLALIAAPAFAQQPPAATVNGQPVTEVAVQRGLKRVPPAEHAKARPEILNYLIDNVLIDQYLTAQKIAVDPKEVEARVAEIKNEVKKK